MMTFLEKEKELLQSLFEKEVNNSIDFNDIETQLKRYNTALFENNERNRRDALNNLVNLFEIPKSSKRTKSFGEKLEEIILPPQIRELFNETIYNIRSRTSDEARKTITEPDNESNDCNGSNQNN